MKSKLSDRLPAIAVIAVLVLGAGAVLSRFMTPSANAVIVAVKVPNLSTPAAAGKRAFDATCASCHGENAAGSGQGPPLVHDIYNPGHHADAAFFLAAKRGVQRHHWQFGDMPPQPRVRDKELESIVRYVRELQVANGIVYRRHTM